MKISLNRTQIKYIAIVAMLVDHIAWLFVSLYSPAGQIMHFIGRLTGPTMAVFVAEGYRYTKDVNKYTLRLAIFALVSWPCFSLMEYGRLMPHFGVIYTLLLALLCIRIYDSNQNWIVKIIAISAMLWLSRFGDWPYYDIIYALIAHIWHDDKTTRWILHTAVALFDVIMVALSMVSFGRPVYYALFETGVLLVPVMFVYLYNGKGGSKHPFHKWFFYVFYPLHMLVLWYKNYYLR